MKKIICLILLSVMLFTTTSCGADEVFDDQSSSSKTEVLDVNEQLMIESFGETPYKIVYTRHGFGECIVTDILIDQSYSGDIDIVIPETSPIGDKVTKLEFIGKRNATNKILPYYTKEGFEKILAKLEEKCEKFDVQRFNSFFRLYDKDSEWAKKDHPIANYCSYYELDPSVSAADMLKLELVLSSYCKFEEEFYYNDALNLLKSIPDDVEIKESVAEKLRAAFYRKGENVKSITIPSSIMSLDEFSLYQYLNLEKISGINRDCMISHDLDSENTVEVSINSHDFYKYKSGPVFKSIWNNLENIAPDLIGPVYELSENGDSYSVVAYIGNITNVVIPSVYNGLPVNTIGANAFENCNTLLTIEIPSSVEVIQPEAFDGCSAMTDIYCQIESQPEGWHDDALGDCMAKIHFGKTN